MNTVSSQEFYDQMMYMMEVSPDLFYLGMEYSYAAYNNLDEIEEI